MEVSSLHPKIHGVTFVELMVVILIITVLNGSPNTPGKSAIRRAAYRSLRMVQLDIATQ